MLGYDLKIKPHDGNFIDIITEKLITVFSIGNAYGIKNNNYIEMLLHIEMDAV